METLEVVELAKNCYRAIGKYACCGDSGDVKCFFCPGCVLSMHERLYNLQMFNMEIYNSKKKCD